jgi:Uncharacterized conserved protein
VRTGVELPSRRATLGLAVLGVIVVAAAVSPTTVLNRLGTLTADPLAFGVAVAALYVVRPALAWPPTLCAAVVGYGYGPAGLPVALAGAAVTAVPPYLAVRWALDDDPDDSGRLLAPLSGARRASERFFNATGPLRGTVAARLAPLPADVTTAAAAAGDVGLRALVVGTVIGELPWTLAAVLLGASAERLAAGGLTAVPLPLAVAAAVGAVLLAAGPLYGLLGGRRDDRSTETSDAGRDRGE